MAQYGNRICFDGFLGLQCTITSNLYIPNQNASPCILNSLCLSSLQRIGSLDGPQLMNLSSATSRMALSDLLPTQTKQSIGDLFLRDRHLVLFHGGNILLPFSTNLS